MTTTAISPLIIEITANDDVPNWSVYYVDTSSTKWAMASIPSDEEFVLTLRDSTLLLYEDGDANKASETFEFSSITIQGGTPPGAWESDKLVFCGYQQSFSSIPAWVELNAIQSWHLCLVIPISPDEATSQGLKFRKIDPKLAVQNIPPNAPPLSPIFAGSCDSEPSGNTILYLYAEGVTSGFVGRYTADPDKPGFPVYVTDQGSAIEFSASTGDSGTNYQAVGESFYVCHTKGDALWFSGLRDAPGWSWDADAYTLTAADTGRSLTYLDNNNANVFLYANHPGGHNVDSSVLLDVLVC